jgi:hypothetical protein
LTFALDAAAFAAVTQTLKANGAQETPAGLRNKEAALPRALSNLMMGQQNQESHGATSQTVMAQVS